MSVYTPDTELDRLIEKSWNDNREEILQVASNVLDPTTLEVLTNVLDRHTDRLNQQKRLTCDMANAIDFVLMETIGEHVNSEDLMFISDELKTAVFDVLAGTDDGTKYHVIVNEGNEVLDKYDLMPGIFGVLFDDVNN